MDVWSDAAVQAKLQGAYRNDHIYHRIMSELAAHGFQCNVKQCRGKLKALKRNIKRLSTGIGKAEQAWNWTNVLIE